jgi:hypothetical protein
MMFPVFMQAAGYDVSAFLQAAGHDVSAFLQAAGHLAVNDAPIFSSAQVMKPIPRQAPAFF